MTTYGILSLADYLEDPHSGGRVSQAARLQRVVDMAVQAEEAGFTAFGVGEHHFSGYILSAPELVLAAAAARTSRIRLGTSVTLLANTDPVRQAEQLATLDVLSNGRAEMTFARGVSEDTANAFGIADFDELRPRFEEYLRLVLRLFTEESVTWEGKYRSPLNDIRLEPRPIQQPHPGVWIGGGLSTTSADLAATLGLPLFLPSLFRWPEDYLDVVDQYRQRFVEAGHGERSGSAFPAICTWRPPARRPDAAGDPISSTTATSPSRSVARSDERPTSTACCKGRRSAAARPRWSSGSARSTNCSASIVTCSCWMLEQFPTMSWPTRWSFSRARCSQTSRDSAG